MNLVNKRKTHHLYSKKALPTNKVNISQISKSSVKFDGIFRINSCRSMIARTGKNYLRFIMEDSSGTMTAYKWNPTSANPSAIADKSHFQIRGKSRYYNGSYISDIISIKDVSPTPEQQVATLPHSKCSRPESLSKFSDIILNIEHRGLRNLLSNVFSQEHIFLPFIQVPASLKYHHNYQGGLLEHSLECASIIQDLSIFSQTDRELGISSALLHDLGKIKTIGVNFSRPEIGKSIDHDAITLEICASALAKFDQDYPKLGIDLRHILTCRSTRRWGYEPKIPIAHAVQLADRLSSDRSLKRSSHSLVKITP